MGQDVPGAAQGARLGIQSAAFLPLGTRVAISDFRQEHARAHTLQGMFRAGEHAAGTDGGNLVQGEILFAELEPAADLLQHQGDLVVDDGFGEVERHQGVQQTGHIEDIHAAQIASNDGHAGLETRLGIVDL